MKQNAQKPRSCFVHKRRLLILVIEDNERWREFLRATAQERFSDADVQTVDNGTAAKERIRRSNTRWDLVFLDVALGKDQKGAPHPDGYELLADLAKCGQAFFVCIVTGIHADESLVETFGLQKAVKMKIAGPADTFPAERLRVLCKPSIELSSDVSNILNPYLQETFDAFCEADSYKNVFRKVWFHGDNPRMKTKHIWEIRFDGGKTFYVWDKPGFHLMQAALKNQGTALNVVTLESGESEPSASRRDDSTQQETAGVWHSRFDESDPMAWIENIATFIAKQERSLDELNDQEDGDASKGIQVEEEEEAIEKGRQKYLERLIRDESSAPFLGGKGFRNILICAKQIARRPKDALKPHALKVIPVMNAFWEKLPSTDRSLAGKIAVQWGTDSKELGTRRRQYYDSVDYLAVVGLAVLAEHFGREIADGGAMKRGGAEINYAPEYHVQWKTDDLKT